MQTGKLYVSFVAVMAVYLGALVCSNVHIKWSGSFNVVLPILPLLAGLSLLTYLLRYARWHWMMLRAGRRLKWHQGFLAYLTGFALTATPGKVGELVRIRYFARLGVTPWRVLAAFAFERACDLVAVLILASFAIGDRRLFVTALAFVTIFLTSVGLIATRPVWLTRIAAYLRLHSFKRVSMQIRTLRNGLMGCGVWMNLLDLAVGLGVGLLAWSITALGFVLMIEYLGVALPFGTGIAIYPLAMLAGAASMLSGGIGTTEAAIVLLLSHHRVPLSTATLAAVCIRLTSRWFAVACGMAAIGLFACANRLTKIGACASIKNSLS